MAHMIRQDDGILTVGEKPWHGLGVTLDTPPATALEALQIAGMDWTCTKQRMKLEEDDRTVKIVGSTKKRDGYWGCVVRDDTKEQLGVVGPSFQILQNRKLASLFEPFIAEGKLRIETCGSLMNGRRVWMLGKLEGEQEIQNGGDIVRKYWMIAHGHDGSLAARVGFTPVRVVCWNTLSASLTNAASSLVKCLHTQSLENNLETLMRAMNATDEVFDLTCDQYRQLASRGVSRTDLREYARIIVDAPKDELKWTNPQRKKIGEIVGAAVEGIGNKGASWWDALNGVTEQLTWHVGRQKEVRLNSLWFGENYNLNQRALDLALDMSLAS